MTGIDAKIVMLIGKWFPTGAHKVGAAYGCLIPSLVTGNFDPESQKAVWPSAGNYCRGGAYDSALLGCESIAILPEGMSAERFEWLSKVAGESAASALGMAPALIRALRRAVGREACHDDPATRAVAPALPLMDCPGKVVNSTLTLHLTRPPSLVTFTVVSR